MPHTRGALIVVDRHRRHDAGALGARLHPVLRGGQAPDPGDLRFERVDVVSGAALTGIIGAFVLVACAATLHATGHANHDARDAAVASSRSRGIWPRPCSRPAWSAQPCSPPRSSRSRPPTRSPKLRPRGRLDDSFTEAPFFYLAYLGILGLGAALVLIPGVPLVPVLFLTQVLNAVLLLPLLVAMRALGRNKRVLGEFANGRAVTSSRSEPSPSWRSRSSALPWPGWPGSRPASAERAAPRLRGVEPRGSIDARRPQLEDVGEEAGLEPAAVRAVRKVQLSAEQPRAEERGQRSLRSRR